MRRRWAFGREARAVLEFLQSESEFPGPAYGSPGRTTTRIDVYGVTSSGEQERLAGLVEGARDSRGWKPVVLRFYEREVLEQLGNGVTQRGQEALIRSIRID